MKHLIIVIISIFALTSCAFSIKDIEETYQWGTEQALKATSSKELSEVTYKVHNRLIKGGKGIGADRKLSQKEMKRYIQARNKYEETVNRKSRELRRAESY